MSGGTQRARPNFLAHTAAETRRKNLWYLNKKVFWKRNRMRNIFWQIFLRIPHKISYKGSHNSTPQSFYSSHLEFSALDNPPLLYQPAQPLSFGFLIALDTYNWNILLLSLCIIVFSSSSTYGSCSVST